MGLLAANSKAAMSLAARSADREVGMKVLVFDNDVTAALRVLKKKLQRDGLYREMRRRRAFEKPSVRAAREKQQNVRRCRKALRKRMEREGY